MSLSGWYMLIPEGHWLAAGSASLALAGQAPLLQPISALQFACKRSVSHTHDPEREEDLKQPRLSLRLPLLLPPSLSFTLTGEVCLVVLMTLTPFAQQSDTMDEHSPDSTTAQPCMTMCR